MSITKQQEIESSIRACLWNAYYHGNWNIAIEEIKLKMKLLSELHDKDREYWEGYNEPDLK